MSVVRLSCLYFNGHRLSFLIGVHVFLCLFCLANGKSNAKNAIFITRMTFTSKLLLIKLLVKLVKLIKTRGQLSGTSGCCRGNNAKSGTVFYVYLKCTLDGYESGQVEV